LFPQQKPRKISQRKAESPLDAKNGGKRDEIKIERLNQIQWRPAGRSGTKQFKREESDADCREEQGSIKEFWHSAE
jgi:hypothetical protein